MRHIVRAGILCVLAAGIAGALPSEARADAEWTTAPVSARFLNAAARGRTATAGGRMTGYRQGPIDFASADIARARLEEGRAGRAALPLWYDLRTGGHVTPVRDQAPYGTCWAFAALGSLESTMLKAGGASPDLAERHLAYFAYSDDVSFTTDVTPIYDAGGADFQAVAVLARGRGAANESDCPYGGADNPTGREPTAAHLTDALHMPQINIAAFLNATPYPALLRDVVKQAIFDRGAVSVVLWAGMDELPSSWNAATNAFYSGPAVHESDHGVVIVGWDDTYAAANFTTPPPGPGAWIVKNSWGTAWGDNGYFRVSYHEPSLGGGVAYAGTTTKPYARRYDYDPLGWVSNIGAGSDTAWFANIWTAKATETLAAAAFYAYIPGSTYEIRVYRRVSAGDPDSGTMTQVAQGTLPETGYHTVPFKTPVPVTSGDRFSVAVRLTTPGWNFPVPMETVLADYSEQATANPGESFFGLTGSDWADVTIPYPNANVCLKVFARAGTPSPSDIPIIPPQGNGGGCGLGAHSAWAALLLLPLLATGRRSRRNGGA